MNISATIPKNIVDFILGRYAAEVEHRDAKCNMNIYDNSMQLWWDAWIALTAVQNAERDKAIQSKTSQTYPDDWF